jgi:hypothetical protein
MNDKPVSKLLVLDDSPDHARRIKQFCDANNLVALKVRRGAVMSVLGTNIDLGGILYSETYGGSLEESARIAAEIHRARPELPIIIRRETQASLSGLPTGAQQVFFNLEWSPEDFREIAQDVTGLVESGEIELF